MRKVVLQGLGHTKNFRLYPKVTRSSWNTRRLGVSNITIFFSLLEGLWWIGMGPEWVWECQLGGYRNVKIRNNENVNVIVTCRLLHTYWLSMSLWREKGGVVWVLPGKQRLIRHSFDLMVGRSKASSKLTTVLRSMSPVPLEGYVMGEVLSMEAAWVL